MATPLTWRRLVPGMIAALAIVTSAAAILGYGSVSALHGKTTRVFAATSEARGIMRGSEVWLEGRKVGIVSDVAFLPPSRDSTRRVLLALDILEEFRPYVRRDAPVDLRPGGSMIAPPVVHLGGGTPTAPAVAAGDTLVAIPQTDLEAVSSQMTGATRQLPAILGNVRLLTQQLKSTKGTLGALGIDRGGPALDQTMARVDRLSAAVQSRRGTIGRLLNDGPALTARARRAMARADSVKALVSSDRSALGRFRRDSTLLRQVNEVRDELAIVRARLASPDGTLGRARADSALFDALSETQREMAALFEDMRAHPLRYVRF